jgi:hypothetical protein
VTTKRVALALGAVVLAVGVVAGRERPALELFPERTTQAPAPAADDIDLERLRRAESSTPRADPFSRKGFEEPGRPSRAVPKARPAPPPLPFQYFGRLTENGRTEVFILYNEELVAIEPGQRVGAYLVESVEEKSIAFTYLPLKTQQRLELQ